MADLTALATALAGRQEKLDAKNPYFTAQSFISNFQPQFDSGTKYQDKLMFGLAQALAGSVANQLGESRKAEQQQRGFDFLRSALKSDDIASVPGARDEFGDVANVLELTKIQDAKELAAKRADENRKFNLESLRNPTEINNPNGTTSQYVYQLGADGGKPTATEVGSKYTYKPTADSTVTILPEDKRAAYAADQADRLRNRIYTNDPEAKEVLPAIQAVERLGSLLQLDGQVAEGLQKVEVAKGIAQLTGMMSDKDLDRFVPETMGQKIRAFRNAVLGGQSATLDPEVKQALITLQSKMSAELLQKKTRIRDRYARTLDVDLPYMPKERRETWLNDVLSGFGGGLEQKQDARPHPSSYRPDQGELYKADVEAWKKRNGG